MGTVTETPDYVSRMTLDACLDFGGTVVSMNVLTTAKHVTKKLVYARCAALAGLENNAQTLAATTAIAITAVECVFVVREVGGGTSVIKSV